MKAQCDTMYICERYGLNRISLACIVKIRGGKCPKYMKDDEGEIVEKEI